MTPAHEVFIPVVKNVIAKRGYAVIGMVKGRGSVGDEVRNIHQFDIDFPLRITRRATMKQLTDYVEALRSELPEGYKPKVPESIDGFDLWQVRP